MAADLSQKLQEVLAAYLEAKENGARVEPQALVRAHPELAAELNEFFANEKQFASAAGGLMTAPTRPTNSQVGEYELLGEIARGGMGVVYRARHRRLQRVVALKMMLAGEFAGRDGMRRFRTEAEVVAGLDHPHIVPIYDIGEHDGQVYFTMKLIEGSSLKSHIAWYVGKPKAAVQLVIQIARAVHHAHQRGVLHRDLKPGNILMHMAPAPKKPAKKGDYPTSGVPKGAQGTPLGAIPYVTDFGLAKRVQADGKASHSTAIVGTAAYMAPEQATGKEALSVAADVYSLGAILFELLTGRAPFVGDNQVELLLRALEQEAPSPLQFQPDLDPDLAHICLKCLRKKPDERYPSAEALAGELEAWLDGEPLSVRAPTRVERVLRWCRRHPRVALAPVLILMLMPLVIAGLIGGNVWLGNVNADLQNAIDKLDNSEKHARHMADEAQRAAEEARKAAEREREKSLELTRAKAELTDAKADLTRLLVQEYLGNGQQALDHGDARGAAIWFAAALEKAPTNLLQRVRLGTTLRAGPPLAQVWFFDDKIRLLRLSPAGDRMIVAAGKNATLWDTRSAARLATLRSDGPFIQAAFSPDGRLIGILGGDGVVRLWSSTNGAVHATPIKQPTPIARFVFGGDGQALATATEKSVRLWNAATAKPQGKPFAHEGEIRALAFHPDGKKLLVAHERASKPKAELHLWDIASAKRVNTWPLDRQVLSIAVTRDGKRVIAVDQGHKVHLWHATGTGAALMPPPHLHVKGEHTAWFAPSGERFVQLGDAEVRLVDIPKGNTAVTIAQDGPSYFAQVSPDGRYVATASANRGVRLWHPDTGKPAFYSFPHYQTVSHLAFSANDDWLATATDDNCVRLWSLAWPERDATVTIPRSRGALTSVGPDGETMLCAQPKALSLRRGNDVLANNIPLTGPIVQSAWSSDGRHVMTATRDDIRVSQTAAGKLVATWRIDKLDDTTWHAHLSNDAREIVLWSRTQVKIWDQDGRSIFEQKMQVLDGDGKRLAVVKGKNTLEILESTGKKSRSLTKLAVLPDAFRFSPDGRSGALAFADGSLRIWDLDAGKPMTPPFGQGESVRHLAFSPDGAMLAGADANGIRVWECATGLPLTPPIPIVGTLAGLTFRADGQMLVAWTTDNRVQQINLTPIEGEPAMLLRLAQVNAGQEIQTTGLAALSSDPFAKLWRELHKSAP